MFPMCYDRITGQVESRLITFTEIDSYPTTRRLHQLAMVRKQQQCTNGLRRFTLSSRRRYRSFHNLSRSIAQLQGPSFFDHRLIQSLVVLLNSLRTMGAAKLCPPSSLRTFLYAALPIDRAEPYDAHDLRDESTAVHILGLILQLSGDAILSAAFCTHAYALCDRL